MNRLAVPRGDWASFAEVGGRSSLHCATGQPDRGSGYMFHHMIFNAVRFHRRSDLAVTLLRLSYDVPASIHQEKIGSIPSVLESTQ
jgi:hypothetical protein